MKRYRKIMDAIWNEIGLFQVTDAQLTSQVRCIRERGRLSEVEIEEIKRRKRLTIYRSMHPKGDVDRLYWKRKEDGWGLLSEEDAVKIEKTP